MQSISSLLFISVAHQRMPPLRQRQAAEDAFLLPALSKDAAGIAGQVGDKLVEKRARDSAG